jgi:hypothetical protein
MDSPEPKHDVLSYNKKFKPGSAGVKLAFSPDEMAFSREDMPLRAAAARRAVLLSLQPPIDGVSKKKWCNDVMVFSPFQPFYPQVMYCSEKNQHDPDFRRDFYDPSPIWDDRETINSKLERHLLRSFTEASREGTINASTPLAHAPLLVKRQIQYAKKIKEEGIPAAQPPPPFNVKQPKMSKKSRNAIRRFDVCKHYHDGTYIMCEALGGRAWSCCGDTDENAPGCCHRLSNPKRTLYD